MKKDTTKIGNGFIQWLWMDKSTRQIWVKTLLCRVDYSILANWTGTFPILGVPVFSTFILFRNKFLYANSVDPEQKAHSAVFDMGLHCFLASLLWDARHKWVSKTYF